jgi:hypothetical protein
MALRKGCEIVKTKINGVPGITMMVFGVLIAATGLVGLFSPRLLFSMLGFVSPVHGIYVEIFARASSQASLAMGAYYILAATTNNQAFYRWSVPVRVVNFSVFTGMVLAGAPVRWMLVACLELAGALATGLALRKEKEMA